MDDLIGTVESAVTEMDTALGERVSAMVLSGAMAPPRRGVRTQEGPQFLTSRVLVAPMVRALGYTDVTSIRRETESVPGLVIAIAPANCPLSEASSNLVGAMHVEGIGRGMATDGMRWLLAESDGGRARVVCMADLRPYYVEALDRRRFRVAVEEDRRPLALFGHLFSKAEERFTWAVRTAGRPGSRPAYP